MNYVIKISKSVEKQIDDLPNTVKERILEKIKGLAIEPRPSGIVKLKNSEYEYRLRVDDYRVRYEIDDAKQITALCANNWVTVGAEWYSVLTHTCTY